MEVAGIEPASDNEDFKTSTCLVQTLFSSDYPPSDWMTTRPASFCFLPLPMQGLEVACLM